MRHSSVAAATIGFAISLLAAPAAQGVTYHVDCQSGSDGAAGTTSETAWKTVQKVSETVFAPGDAILFRRGTRCQGMLSPKGSGDEQRPIRIGSYGQGRLPIIDGGTAPAAIRLFNQQGWQIQHVEAVGGNPHGIYIGGDGGTLRHLRLRDLIVRDVAGEPTTKYSGLVVIDGSPGAAMEDVVIDGLVAHHTTQWAGVIVVGPSRDTRTRRVTVRNTVVHHVFGDGIVLYQVEDGLIEKSAAWLTGLQPKETVGTPNGIWTWRCRRCTVQFTEGFFTDSPGVDGGVYDIDWGNEDNVVQHNYGHDAQGYCLSVFGAAKETTTNSVLRHNVCLNNGRSPKLARRQGDLYITTWDGGALDGVLVHNNTFHWTPAIDAPVIQAIDATFTGSRANRVFDNVIVSAVPSMSAVGRGLQLERNLYWYAGSDTPKWNFDGKDVTSPPGGDFADPRLDPLLRPLAGSPLAGGTAGAVPVHAGVSVPAPQAGRWTLRLHAATSAAEARSQLVFLEAAMAQYGDSRLTALVSGAHEWPLERVRVVAGEDAGSGVLLALTSPSGRVVREWRTFAPPADLGLTLRHVLRRE
jgi:hypothetical protein